MSDNDPFCPFCEGRHIGQCVDGPEYDKEQQAAQDQFYEWLSAFELLQRALAHMECDPVANTCGSDEWFRGVMQKQWEQQQMIVRCC